MIDRLSGLFESAVGMLPMSEERSLEMFSEITSYDETPATRGLGVSVVATPTG